MPTTTTKTKAALTKQAGHKTPATPVTIVTPEEICAGVRDQAAIETDVDATTADVIAPATDTAVDESPVLPVADTLPTPPIAQTTVDEAPATPPVITVENLHTYLETDPTTLYAYLTGLLNQSDAVIVAALKAEIIHVGTAARPARATRHTTGSTSVQVTCAHCAKHFLGRPSQQECRVCTDYAKAHNGQPRPLNGTKSDTAPVTTGKAATAGKAASKKKRGSKQPGTHRPH